MPWGGLEVALACDIRIAEQQAKLGLPEASVGLLPCAGGTQRLTELVGPGWAKRMILCGEKVSATLAYEMGLVEEVVTEGHAWEAAQQMAQLVERQSPSALRACKQLINQGAAATGTRRCRSSAASFSPCLTMPTSAKGWRPSWRSGPALALRPIQTERVREEG
jgi:enoyl-CoA hydratase/carnithine racemase